jgi:hypothetical protein
MYKNAGNIILSFSFAFLSGMEREELKNDSHYKYAQTNSTWSEGSSGEAGRKSRQVQTRQKVRSSSFSLSSSQPASKFFEGSQANGIETSQEESLSKKKSSRTSIKARFCSDDNRTASQKTIDTSVTTASVVASIALNRATLASSAERQKISGKNQFAALVDKYFEENKKEEEK